MIIDSLELQNHQGALALTYCEVQKLTKVPEPKLGWCWRGEGA